MIVSVASGKGGTGKTFVATNLAATLGKRSTPVTYVDADVEAPNGHLFLHPKLSKQKSATTLVPFSPSGSCTGCGNCQSVCAFNAIISVGQKILVFDELCHGCGACLLSCSDNFLSERFRTVGVIDHGTSGHLNFWSGTLNVGEPRATPMIDAVISNALSTTNRDDLVIIDAPPGTSCAAMAAVERANVVLLVAEPTRLGLHDFKRTVQMAQSKEKPIVAIVNRADLGTNETVIYLGQQNIPVFAVFDYNPTVARCGSEGTLAIDYDKTVQQTFSSVAQRLVQTYGEKR